MESTILSNVALLVECIVILAILITVRIIGKKNSILLLITIVLADAFFVHAILLGTKLQEIAVVALIFAIPLLTSYIGRTKE